MNKIKFVSTKCVADVPKVQLYIGILVLFQIRKHHCICLFVFDKIKF